MQDRKSGLQLTTAMMPSYVWSSLFWIDAITSNACPARSVTITFVLTLARMKILETVSQTLEPFPLPLFGWTNT
jgi:hypothetical protein